MFEGNINEFRNKCHRISPPIYFTLSKSERKVAMWLLYLMAVPLIVAVLYGAFVTHAVVSNSTALLVPWLDYSQPVVDFMAKFVPIIKKLPEDASRYQDHYIRAYQSTYAVSWAFGAVFISFAMIQLLILAKGFWAKTTDMDLRNYKKVLIQGSPFVMVAFFLGYYHEISFNFWPFTISLFFFSSFIFLYAEIFMLTGLIICLVLRSQNGKE